VRRHFFAYFLVLLCRISCYSQPNGDSLGLGAMGREDSSLVNITRMNINSAQSDFSPVVSGKKIYFVSGRNNKVGVQYADIHNKTEITDLYQALLTAPGKARSVQPLAGVNTKYYEGPFCFNLKEDTLYYTGNDKRSNKLKIFMCTRDGDKWTKGELLPFCNDTFSYCHPTISFTGKELYFSSDRTQGNNMDIFVSVLKNGVWQEPVNIGPRINTVANEVFPFAGAPGQLFFASNRPGGMGGLDLYNARLSDTSAAARILYPPLNSAGDDFGIWTDTSGAEGYFSTNRYVKQGDDIYMFTRSIPDFTGAETPQVRRKFCYTFYEETSLNSADTANMAFEWRFGDGASARGLTTRHCYTSTGVYNVELVVVEKTSGEVNSSVLNYEVDIPAQEQLVINSADTVKTAAPVMFDSSPSRVKGFEIRSTWWNFGDGFYNSGPTVQHRYRKVGKYVVQLWILATDKVTGDTKKFKTQKQIIVGP
jgi:hypothetical protein